MTNEVLGPWARHYQEAWQSRAGDPRLPHWLRVTAAGYGSHGNNGHALFKRGQLALILAAPDKRTGAIRPYTNLGRAIDEAVEYGWLEEESYWGCLIVPAHAIKKGAYGTVGVCPIHVKRRNRVANRSLSEGPEGLSSTLSEAFAPRSPRSAKASRAESLTQRGLPRVGPSALSVLPVNPAAASATPHCEP